MWTDIGSSFRDYKIGKMQASWYKLVIRHAQDHLVPLHSSVVRLLELALEFSNDDFTQSLHKFWPNRIHAA